MTHHFDGESFPSHSSDELASDLADALNTITRLRAENERLAARILAWEEDGGRLLSDWRELRPGHIARLTSDLVAAKAEKDELFAGYVCPWCEGSNCVEGPGAPDVHGNPPMRQCPCGDGTMRGAFESAQRSRRTAEAELATARGDAERLTRIAEIRARFISAVRRASNGAIGDLAAAIRVAVMDLNAANAALPRREGDVRLVRSDDARPEAP